MEIEAFSESNVFLIKGPRSTEMFIPKPMPSYDRPRYK